MKIIFNKQSPGSINTIDQNGKNELHSLTQPSSESFWEKTKWLRWLLGIAIAITGIIMGGKIFYNFYIMSDNFIQPINSPGSINTINQVGDNQIMTGNPPRVLTKDIANELIQKLTKNKKVQILTFVNNPEVLQYAEQIKNLLEKNGWTVDPNFVNFMMPAFGIDIRENPEKMTIIVGSAS